MDGEHFGMTDLESAQPSVPGFVSSVAPRAAVQLKDQEDADARSLWPVIAVLVGSAAMQGAPRAGQGHAW
ncbi:hypothetical protein AS156_00920 [Bradyrhizobium macuxiense]|uniref:Uncharacterized protein n=1 Tax=Bradyrhizobium macuxiense TaxID=1755647 RepID=A0A125Q8I7_9BRAD|nr:hypothetical protein AS156_00920 [Bradyrhizobium macuxiense]